jgi:two-component system LytT family sensor kinase
VKVRIAVAVVAGWLLVALIWASQVVLEGTLQGDPVAAPAALRSALIQTVPWIPVTLATIALATRFPVTLRTWRRHLPVHIAAFAFLVWFENVLVVFGFWLSQARFGGLIELAWQGGYWAILRVHLAALVYVAIAGLTQMLAFYRAARTRELRVARLEGQLARARLDALNAQIRPHFLFNTLHTIGQLWRSGRADEADAMLDHLGSLFQRVRQTTERHLVSLRDELDMVQDYLAIERVRFQDRLSVEVQADERALGCAVPPLLLQPIVENAVRHGVAATSSAGRIEVEARLENGWLHLSVDDDGPGPGSLAQDRPDRADDAGTGTGIPNTRDRLRQLFSERHTFEIRTLEPHGTGVRITVPAQSAGDVGDGITAHVPDRV